MKEVIILGRTMGKTCYQVEKEAERLELETATPLIFEPTRNQRKKSKGQKFGKSKYF